MKPLATHYICVGTVAGTMSCYAFVSPRHFGRSPPLSPHPRKRASECAGTATGLVIQSKQRFSLVMFAFCVYENNLGWLVIDQSFNLASSARKHPTLPEVTNLINAERDSRRWCSLLSPPSSSIPCFHNLSCFKVSEPWGPLPSTLMDIYCAWATLCRQDFCLIEFCVR